jgi:hypothetical protein
MTETPVRPIRVVVQDSGLLRVEWCAARYGQLVPINWSMGAILETMGGYMPLRYQVADAQNMIVAEAIAKDYEWLFLLEHDVIIPPDTFIRLNRYMKDAKAPVVSGLYFSRSFPSDPMVFKTYGDSYYDGWQLGDVVEVIGIPTGCALIHMALIRAMWADSEEYLLNGIKVRRVFNTPRDSWVNPETGEYNASQMTSDLDWCKRVVDGDYLHKSGWTEYADKPYPFLVDTNIFCYHINHDGTKFPDKQSLALWERA